MKLRPTRPVVFAAVFGMGLAGIALWLDASRRPDADHRIVCIAVSSSGRWIAAGTHTGAIAILDRDNPGSLQRIRADSGELNDLQFSPDERLLAVATRELTTYSVGDLSRPRFLRSDDRNYGTARFSSDGRRLLTITGAATIEVLDADSGELQLRICCTTIGGETAFSPDGSMIVTAGHWPAFWDARSGQMVRRLTKDREFLTFLSIAFDSVRSWVLMGSQDSRVYAWDLRSGQRAEISRSYAGYVDSVVVLKDSPSIACVSRGGPVRLWNPESEAERRPGPMLATSNLVAGTQPHSISFGTATGFIELWDIAGEKILQRYDLR